MFLTAILLLILKINSKRGEEERSQMQQQAQQNQSEAIKEQTRVQKEIADRNFELKQYEIDQNNSTKIEVAQLQTYFQKADLDANNNGIPDIIDIEKLAFERQKLAQQDLHARLESTQSESPITAITLAPSTFIKPPKLLV